jgi:hypothetical protein
MDLDTMLTGAAPSRHVLLDGPDSLAAARIRERIISDPPPPVKRRYVARGLTVAAIAGAAVIVAVAVIPGSPGSLEHPDSAAAAVLGQAVVTASRQPATPAAGPGQYEYVKTIQELNTATGTGKIGGKVTWRDCDFAQTVQYWVANDGSGRSTASAPPACVGLASPSQTFAKGQEGAYVYPDAAALPTDPAALKQLIEQKYEGSTPDDGATFQFAGTILMSGAPPKIRAAIYRMIENLPGVQFLGSMTDKLGRHGIAVGYTEYGVRDVLIFDPATSAILEREGVAVDPAAIPTAPGIQSFKTGQVINYTVYVESAVVNSDTATPAAAG